MPRKAQLIQSYGLLHRLDTLAKSSLEIHKTRHAELSGSINQIGSTHAVRPRAVVRVVGVFVRRSCVNDRVMLEFADKLVHRWSNCEGANENREAQVFM